MSDEKPTEETSKSENIIEQNIEVEMKKSYIDYAMSVIVGRALPDVRDGLKPVHRRILYAMNEMNMRFNTSFKKSARVVGEVLGKYHPHGDQAVYDSMVRMAQDFSLRYPLINGQGNWGSIDGDSAAAMRYTEAKMMKITDELLADINKETVDYADNFDGSLKEPKVLPTKLPALLINGSSGIAVGMATNMPPHNLNEVGNALIALIDNPDMELKELIDHVKGPDFPTGGTILGTNGIASAYQTGRGRVKVRAVINEEQGKRRRKLIISEIPYMVNKSSLVLQIADAVKNKKIEGIADLRDESDRKGMRIVIELKNDANTEIVTNQLYKYTRCQETFGIINLALVNGQPKVLPLKSLLSLFLDHRKVVIKRRTEFDLKKAQARAHILEGLVKALNHIDNIIALIKSAETVQTAQEQLMSTYSLSDKQSKAILDMRLSKLAALEQEKIKDELKQINELIKELEFILANEQKVLSIIKEETQEIIDTYKDERRTQIIEGGDEDIDYEDLIDKEDVVVTISTAGYIKRIPKDTYKAQRRGGKGIIGASTKEDDILEHLFIANTHSYLLIITDKGILHWLKVYKIPQSGRYAKGTPIINLVRIGKGEKVSAVIPVKEFDDKHFLFMATKQGVVKKTNLSAFSRPRQGGIIALSLDENDSVIGVRKTDGTRHILLATAKGMAVRFDENNVRPMGRTARGVRGIKLAPNDHVVAKVVTQEDGILLTITENGYGKRTRISDYRLIGRGGKGVRNIICSSRNGDVVAVRTVNENDDVLFITEHGVVIRTPVKDISVIGRNTQGLRLMRLSSEDKVASAAKIIQDEEDINAEDIVDE